VVGVASYKEHEFATPWKFTLCDQLEPGSLRFLRPWTDKSVLSLERR